MPHPLTFILIGIAAVLAYNGVGHLRGLGSPRRDRLTTVFGLLCLLGAGYALACLYGYRTTEISATVAASRVNVIFLRLITVILPWFIALYADFKPRRFLIGLSCALAAHAVANTLIPATFLYAEVTGITFQTTPWGEKVAALTGPLSPRAYLIYALDLAIVVFVAEAARRLWQRGARNRALPLIAVVAFACVTFVNDTLLDAGRIRSIYLEEFVVFAFLLVIDSWLGTRKSRAQANYRNLFHSVAEAISVHDARTGQVLDVNESSAALFRSTRSDLLTGDAARTIAGTPPYTLAETVARIRQAGIQAPQVFEWLCRHVDDGTLFWSEVATHTAVIDGRPVILISHRDVTERKKAQDALRESETRYRAIVEGFDGFLFINAQDGTIEFMNDRLIAYLGRNATGEKWQHVLAAFDDLWMDDATGRVCQGETVRQQARHNQDGRRYDVINTPIHHADGSVSRQVMMTDVTEQRLAEEERQALEAKMKQLQKIETLGLLAGSVAHDFNNLLTAVLGNAEVALKELGPAVPGRGAVSEIRTIALRAGDLCRQLLATSRQGALVRQPIELGKIVEETARFVEVSLPHTVRLDRAFADEVPLVRADPTQLRQIVLNLITNASESLGEPGGAIELGLRLRDLRTDELRDFVGDPELPAGAYVELRVRDGGRGMDRETKARLFEPFFSTKQSGRGLGMPAVLGIVRAHRGAIGIDSEPSRGTTVTVLLPAAPPGTAPAEPRTATPALGTHGGTVLVVDDNLRVLQAITRLIQSLGYQTRSAGGGREALDIYRAEGAAIDCVLLDVMMPDMDGWETLEQLKAIDPAVTVVLSSGYADRGGRRSNLSGEHPMLFLQKPYVEADLCAVLEQAIRLRAERRAPG